MKHNDGLYILSDGGTANLPITINDSGGNPVTYDDIASVVTWLGDNVSTGHITQTFNGTTVAINIDNNGTTYSCDGANYDSIGQYSLQGTEYITLTNNNQTAQNGVKVNRSTGEVTAYP